MIVWITARPRPASQSASKYRIERTPRYTRCIGSTDAIQANSRGLASSGTVPPDDGRPRITKNTRFRIRPGFPKTAIADAADTPTAKITNTEYVHNTNAFGNEVPTAVQTPM